MNPFLITFGIIVFLIVPIVYITGALTCFNDALDDASGNTVSTAEINDLGAFGLFNVSLSILTVGKVKMRNVHKSVRTAEEPICGFMMKTMYFFKNTLLDYIVLPFVAVLLILFGALMDDTYSENNSSYTGYNNNYKEYNNGSGYTLGGSRRRKLKR
jgi:hypothetical protein